MVKRSLTLIVAILVWANNPLLARPMSHGIAQSAIELRQAVMPYYQALYGVLFISCLLLGWFAHYVRRDDDPSNPQ